MKTKAVVHKIEEGNDLSYCVNLQDNFFPMFRENFEQSLNCIDEDSGYLDRTDYDNLLEEYIDDYAIEENPLLIIDKDKIADDGFYVNEETGEHYLYVFDFDSGTFMIEEALKYQKENIE
jgi:hypothetical protein